MFLYFTSLVAIRKKHFLKLEVHMVGMKSKSVTPKHLVLLMGGRWE